MMKKQIFLTAMVLFLSSASYALTVKTFTGSASGFLVTSTILEGRDELMLIDAQFTLSDAHRLLAELLETGKPLTKILITHAHPDHFFGLEVIKTQFPQAEVIARPLVATQMKTMGPQKFAYWKPIYGSNLADHLFFANDFQEKTLIFDRVKMNLINMEPGEIENATVIHIPSLSTVVAGDVLYAGVHPWLAEADQERRDQWIRNLEKLASLGAERFVPGHQADNSEKGSELVEFTSQYIQDFSDFIGESDSANSLKNLVLSKYPDLKLPVILDLSVDAVYSVTGSH